MYRLDDEPTKKQVNAVRKDLKLRFRASPDETFLIVFAIAGHGMQMDGR